MPRRSLRGWVAAAATLAALTGSLTSGSASAAKLPPPHHQSYRDARFDVHTSTATFGQAPAFMPDGRIVVGENVGNGTQVYISRRDGSHRHCLTCELAAPNNVPAVRPQGDWILFHSWLGHRITLGSPGYGGIGSQLYVMRPNGSHVTKIFGTAEPENGEGTDDYHAYWSPDGKRVVWAHFNGNFIDGHGQARWDIRVANFDVRNGVPRLTHVRVVRPANTHWYETQWWAPNGKGFLYTESFGTAVNTELFYCRLPRRGICHSTQLTHNQAWDEQAIFTPDMKDVIFMSSRAHPGFFNTYSQLAQDLAVRNGLDNFLVLPVFELAFLQPLAQEATDLYEINLRSHSVRRLTRDGDRGWVIPEFTWNPSLDQLWWTEGRYPRGLSVPLPLNLTRQLNATIHYLEHPTAGGIQLADGNALSAVPIEHRTRYGHFRGVALPH
jgi:Tol biopolymer transport system component